MASPGRGLSKSVQAHPSNRGQYAPAYSIPAKRLAVVEHPMVVNDVDKALKSFGNHPDFDLVLNATGPQISMPMYLRGDNPTTRPLVSYNASSHNVVLKITVPKRTGRKRKRGSADPFQGDMEHLNDAVNDDVDKAPKNTSLKDEIASLEGRDAPTLLRRKLADNVGKYSVEAVGVVQNTHRYRGLADFQYSLGRSTFMNEVTTKLLNGDVSKFRDFDLKPGVEKGKNVEILPPPSFTTLQLPIPYNYAQNPYTKYLSERPSDVSSDNTDEEFDRVVNVTKNIKSFGHFLRHDEYPVPTGPLRKPNMADPEVAEIIEDFRRAMDERPIWTRRSLFNHISTFSPFSGRYQKVRECIQFVGYQFKGGPWRDAVVKYGIDPRSDPKYRIYQTMIFKLTKQRVGSVGRSWQAVRRNEFGVSSNFQTFGKQANAPLENQTHIFDGQSFSTDAKVWQVCDLTDPLLSRLFAEAEVQKECSIENNGWYKVALWGGAKAIMRTKLLAIRFGKNLEAWEWERAIADCNKDEFDWGSSIGFTLPDLKLTPEEREQITGRRIRPGITTGRDRSHEKKKIYRRVKYNTMTSSERKARESAKKKVQAARERREEMDNSTSQTAADDVSLTEHTDSALLLGDAYGEPDMGDAGEEDADGDLDDEVLTGTQQGLFDYLSDLDEEDENQDEDEDDEENEDEAMEDEEEFDGDDDGLGPFGGGRDGPRDPGQYDSEDEDEEEEDEEDKEESEDNSEADEADGLQGPYESEAGVTDDQLRDEDQGE